MQAMPDPSSNQADKGLWHRWRPWLIVILAVLGTLVVLAVVLIALPPLLVPGGRLGPPAPGTVPSAIPSPSLPQPSPAASPAGFADLAKAESDIRGNLVAALGVLAVLIGAVVGFLNFRETQRQNRDQLELTRRGQINERFSRAIGQLGEKIDVRIGAIYSLEQIARDSPDELHGPVIETLAAFLRVQSRPSQQKPELDSPQAEPQAAAEGSAENGPLRADFQVIATVLGRRDVRHDTGRLDLNGVDLRGADLRDAHLERAKLFGAHLERAWLHRAHLEGANLNGANLQKADLGGAHLERAYLPGAHLEGAFLAGAHLEGASFLPAAHLEGANLDGTLLERAHHDDEDLDEEDLDDEDQEGSEALTSMPRQDAPTSTPPSTGTESNEISTGDRGTHGPTD